MLCCIALILSCGKHLWWLYYWVRRRLDHRENATQIDARRCLDDAGHGLGAHYCDYGYRNNIHMMLRALHSIRVPVIAAVNGPAIGLGCDVACLADIRIASEKAKFGVTFLKLGIIPGDGGTWILPRVIGMSRAADLFYTGDVIDAATAKDWGLVSDVVPHDTLMETAMAKAHKIASMPPHSLRQSKMLLRQGQQVNYDTALEMAANTQAMMHMTDDHAEGVAALIEKRAAEFKGQ